MTHAVGNDDIAGPVTVNRILDQLDGCAAPKTEGGRPYVHVPTIVIRPTEDLGGLLDSSVELRRHRYEQGSRAVDALREANV